MKSFIFFIFVFVIMINVVGAVGFSPSSLTFNLQRGEQSCQVITLSSDSETITVSDKWAENKDVEWKVSLFNNSASDFGISINYLKEISINEREVEVCLLGSQVGEYHGVMILKEEQEGNSIIQMGIWLKVIISELPASGEGSGGGGSGGGSSAKATATPSLTTLNNSNLDTNTQNLAGNINIEKEEKIGTEKSSSDGITGSAIGDIEGKKEVKKILIPLITFAIIGFMIYKWKTKK